MSGSLPDRRNIMAWAERVLGWTISQMPNIRAVACLGADAWLCAAGALGVDASEWKSRRESRDPAFANGLAVFALAHPSRFPGGKARVEGDWAAVREGMRVAARTRAA